MANRNILSSINDEFFSPLNHYGPVTALKVHGGLVLVGYGPRLRIFRIDEDGCFTEQHSRQIFKRNKIHSIALSQDSGHVLLSGGRSFCILNLDDISNAKERAINEWIIAAEFHLRDTILLLTSHNEVLEIDVSSQVLRLKQKLHCNEKSLLYSGSINVLNSGKVLIAAGTVMSGVLIWDLFERRIIHSLTDHEGSIFGVRIDSTGLYIASCSDDRSIKLYKIDGTLLASGWGHGSRIWALEFASVDTDSVIIFSAGEDCTARIWKYEGNNTLVQERLFDNFHLGKHVWSGDISGDTFATGGADGKVRVEKVHDVPAKRYLLEEITDKEQGEFIKELAIIPQRNAVLVVTSHGRLFLHLKHTTIPIKPNGIDSSTLQELHSIKTFSASNSAILVTKDGTLLVINVHENLSISQEIISLQDTPKKIISVLSSSDDYTCSILCYSPIPGANFDLLEFKRENGILKFNKKHQLSRPEQKSFVPTSFFRDTKTEMVFIGSRHALFAIYRLHDENTSPIYTTKLCTGDTVTSVSKVHSENEEVSVFITVRDGYYLVMNAFHHEDDLHVKIVLKNKLSRGFIEGGFVRGSDFYLYGFASSSFYLWNETNQCEIASAICGGGHRRWDVCVDDHSPSLWFSYASKAAILVKRMEASFPHEGVLVNGIHGREIRDVCFSPREENDGSVLLATASEDAVVRIGRVTSDGSLYNQWAMNNHISGLQRVGFMGNDYLVSTAANEELIVWKLDHLRNGIVMIDEVKRIQTLEDNPDLRVMDFSSAPSSNGYLIAIAFSNSKIKVAHFDTSSHNLDYTFHINYGTVCILNVQLIQAANTTYLIAGTSDGNLTLWDVSLQQQQPAIKQQIHQSGVKGLLILEKSHSNFDVFTGGDDNALVYSTLSFENGVPHLLVVSFMEQAASATITSISNAFDDRILVTSVDQIVRIWQYTQDTLECIAARYTTVADTGCSDTVKIGGKPIGVFAGAGLSTWAWN